MDIRAIVIVALLLLCCALGLFNLWLAHKKKKFLEKREVLVKDLAAVKKANAALVELVLSRIEPNELHDTDKMPGFCKQCSRISTCITTYKIAGKTVWQGDKCNYFESCEVNSHG